MAGRPRKMAATVAEFEEQAMGVAMAVFDAIPEPYRRDLTADTLGQELDEPLCTAWRRCVITTLQASVACEELGDLVRERAGISELGPSERMMSDLAAAEEPEQGPEITPEDSEC